MQKYLICHYDLDGAGSAIILLDNFQFDTVFKGGYHRFTDFVNWIKPNSDVIAADVELGTKNMASLKEKGCDVLLIDHHPNTKETLLSFPDDVIYDADKSGTRLCFELCEKHGWEMSPSSRIMMKAINAYDLYKRTEEPEWFKLGYDLNLIFWKVHFDQFIARFADGFSGFKQQEKAFLKNKHNAITKALNDSEYFDIGENVKGKVCIPVIPSIMNDVPYHFNQEHGVYYIIQHYPNSVNISVRSSRIDLTEFIESVIGLSGVIDAGGHRNACGINISPNASEDDILHAILKLHISIENSYDDIPF
jgi:oligoribonuclease NrnB/cAMP/cGMP phosphodiesterase (DHH superfamily)